VPALALATMALVCASQDSAAQGYGGSGNGSAGIMWGTSSGSGGPEGFAQSAIGHQALGNTAAQVNAAQAGMLSTSNITIMSIGSQNIVQVTGDNNTVTSKQKASTDGNVSAVSDITMGGK
jgi:hypothetical protein